MNTYISGTLVRTSASFTDVTGAAADPTTVTLKYKAGANSTITINAPAHDGTGAYHYDIDTSGWTGPGNQPYVTEWTGTGTVQVVGVGSWEVEPPAL